MRFDVDLISKLGDINFGGKLNWINNDSRIKGFDNSGGSEVLLGNLSNDYIYTERTQSAYVSLEKKLAPKLFSKFGVRYENTQANGLSSDITNNESTEFDLNYDRFFPTAYLSYRPKDNYLFQLNYNRRIDRPSFWNLNPYTWVITPYLIYQGNPFLQPVFSENTELIFNYKDAFTSKLYWTRINGGIMQVPQINEVNNITNHIYENIYNQDILGVQFTHY